LCTERIYTRLNTFISEKIITLFIKNYYRTSNQLKEDLVCDVFFYFLLNSADGSFSLTFDETDEYTETISERASNGHTFFIESLIAKESPVNKAACSSQSHKLATVPSSACSLDLTSCPAGFSLGFWMQITPSATVAMDTEILLYNHGNLAVVVVFDQVNKQSVNSLVSFKATGESCPFNIYLPLKAWFHLVIHVVTPSQIYVVLNGLTVEDFNKECFDEQFDAGSGDGSGEIRFGESGIETCIDEIFVSKDNNPYSVNGLALNLYYRYTHGKFSKHFFCTIYILSTTSPA